MYILFLVAALQSNSISLRVIMSFFRLHVHLLMRTVRVVMYEGSTQPTANQARMTGRRYILKLWNLGHIWRLWKLNAIFRMLIRGYCQHLCKSLNVEHWMAIWRGNVVWERCNLTLESISQTFQYLHCRLITVVNYSPAEYLLLLFGQIGRDSLIGVIQCAICWRWSAEPDGADDLGRSKGWEWCRWRRSPWAWYFVMEWYPLVFSGTNILISRISRPR